VRRRQLITLLGARRCGGQSRRERISRQCNRVGELPIGLSHACQAAELIAAHCVIPDEKHTKNETRTRQHEEECREVAEKTHSPRRTELEAVPQAECGREAQAGG
jgi:hypothetical protein